MNKSNQKLHEEIWLTPSDVWSYALCPWIVYYRKVLGKYSYESSPEMAVGSFEHEVRRRLSITVPRVNNLENAVEVAHRCINEGYEYAVHNFEAFLFSLNSARQNTASNIIVELDSIINNPPCGVEVDISSERLRLKGRIDCLYKSGNTYIPCDYKTEFRAEGYHSANVLQVTTYALLLEDKFDCKVSTGIIHYTSLRKKQVFDITDKLRKQVELIMSAIRNMIFTGKEPTIDPLGFQHCAKCQYLSMCETRSKRSGKYE